MLKICVFSEMERNMISERVKSGMINASIKGKNIERSTTTIDILPICFLKYCPKYKDKQINRNWRRIA